MESTETQKYIAYYRASTEKQRDGLGLQVQRDRVHQFVNQFGGDLIQEFEEIISGAKSYREQFIEAVNACREQEAILVVYRLDRMSRDFKTVAYMEENGVKYVETEAPFDSEFSKNIKFLIAKDEREKIQRRVTDALGRVKEQIEENGYYITKEGKKITSLGSPENLTDKSRARSIAVRRAKAVSNENNVRAFAVASRLREEGDGYAKIANYLNKHSFKTSRGGKWYAASVSKLLDLFEKAGIS